MGEAIITRRGINNAKYNLPEFTYTGICELIDDGKVDNVQNWRIKFLTSGSITFTKVSNKIDVFCAGGGGGTSYIFSSGGGGGYTSTTKNVRILTGVPYVIIIGAGGTGLEENNALTGGGIGGTSSAFECSANGGTTGSGFDGIGGSGGSGGGGYSYGRKGTDGADGEDAHHAGGKGQGTTTREFGELSGTLYCSGGDACYASGMNAETRVSGAANTGDGGNGGEYSSNSGGSGIVVIRNAR
jgi:hypothetical protein